jgi:hypothetical protein
MHPYVPFFPSTECWLTNCNEVFGRTSHRLQNPSAQPESFNSDCALFCGIQSFTGCGWMLENLYLLNLHVPEEANSLTVLMWWNGRRFVRHMVLKVAARATAALHSGVSAVRLFSRKRRSSHDSSRPTTLVVISLWRTACKCLEFCQL